MIFLVNIIKCYYTITISNMFLHSVFSEGDIFQIKQQGGSSLYIYEKHANEIIDAIIVNCIPKTAFIQLAQNSKKDTIYINNFFKNSELTPKLMMDTIYLAQHNSNKNKKLIICQIKIN